MRAFAISPPPGRGWAGTGRGCGRALDVLRLSVGGACVGRGGAAGGGARDRRGAGCGDRHLRHHRPGGDGSCRLAAGALMPRFAGERVTFAYHGHDTYGLGVANAIEAYRQGIRVFDGAAGGLGGCPFAPGAAGNTASEDLVFAFEHMGVKRASTSPSCCRWRTGCRRGAGAGRRQAAHRAAEAGAGGVWGADARVAGLKLGTPSSSGKPRLSGTSMDVRQQTRRGGSPAGRAAR